MTYMCFEIRQTEMEYGKDIQPEQIYAEMSWSMTYIIIGCGLPEAGP